jgi:hypothetical protein
MKHNNTFTFIVIAVVGIITLLTFYQNTNAPDWDTTSVGTLDPYIWLTVDQVAELAEKNGDVFRVVNIDNEAQIVTMDYVIGRINASIVNGIVTAYSIEWEQ